jgi:hypothetical protein
MPYLSYAEHNVMDFSLVPYVFQLVVIYNQPAEDIIDLQLAIHQLQGSTLPNFEFPCTRAYLLRLEFIPSLALDGSKHQRRQFIASWVSKLARHLVARLDRPNA